MRSRYRFFPILFVLIFTAGAGNGQAQQVRYSGSVQYATGSYYFTERTASLYLNSGLEISGDNISMNVNIPLITQNTPWISYSSTGMGPLPTGGPHSGMVNNGGRSGGNGGNGGNGQGNHMGTHRINPGRADTLNLTKTSFGDPSVSGNIQVYESRFGDASVNANIGIKFPVADPATGFGTGAWDFGGGASWSQRFTGQNLLILSGMYWRLGDMRDLDLNDILSYSAAIGHFFQSGKWLVTASFFGSTQIIDDIDPPLNAGGGISFQASPKVNLNTSVLFGLTESASDFSVGFGWSIIL